MALQTASTSATSPSQTDSNDDGGSNDIGHNSIPFSFLVAFLALFVAFMSIGLFARRILNYVRVQLGLPVPEPPHRPHRPKRSKPVLWDVHPERSAPSEAARWHEIKVRPNSHYNIQSIVCLSGGLASLLLLSISRCSRRRRGSWIAHVTNLHPHVCHTTHIRQHWPHEFHSSTPSYPSLFSVVSSFASHYHHHHPPGDPCSQRPAELHVHRSPEHLPSAQTPSSLRRHQHHRGSARRRAHSNAFRGSTL
jgi:hypothetical protein